MNDLISRQDAIDAITDKNITYNIDSINDSELHRIKRAVHRIIASLPSAQPERKKGKWRHYEGMYFCEICHSALDDISPFCPMCGADMREETDNIPIEYYENGGI